MRELRLRYFIDLASNIGAKARADAQALEQAQKVMQGAITGTNNRLTDWTSLTAKAARGGITMQETVTGAANKFAALDRAITRVGANSSTERQIGYVNRLADSVDRAEKKADRLRKGLMVGGGTLAAMNALKDPAKEAMGFDERLADMANTAYSERDKKGRASGMKTLEAAVNAARRVGGGTREQAADALDTMIASGTVSVADSIKMLPGIVKASTASGAGANELATIAIRAKQSFGIAADDLPALLSSAMKAGQAGGFELKDMAKWLPQQMAMGKNLGLSGKEGFAKLAAWNQASVITAGTKDEAGNNLRDLLNELNTPHFRDFMAKELFNGGKALKKGEKLGKQKQIDDVFLDYQSGGVDKVSATVDLMDKLLAKNPTYAKLQAKLQALPKEDKEGRRMVLESMAAQVQGTATGKVFHNQQSLMAFLALSNNREYTADVLGKVREEIKTPADASEVNTSHGVKSAVSGYKVRQAEEDKKMAEKAAMDRATPSIGAAADKFSDLVSSNPEASGAALLLGKAAAAAAAVGGGIYAFLRRGGGAGASTVAGGAAEAGAAGGAASAGAVASGASKLSMLARGVSAMNPLLLIEALTGPSDDDIARLREMDRQKAGYRGQGFDDPRRLDRAAPLPDPTGGPRVDRFAPLPIVANGSRMGFGLGVPQLDFMTLTAPGVASAPLKAGQTTEVKVGEGRISIDVRVSDERVNAASAVTQQPSLIKLDAGATNPGGNAR